MASFRDEELESPAVKSSGILKWTIGIVILTLLGTVLFAQGIGTEKVATIVQQGVESARSQRLPSRAATQSVPGGRELTYRATANGHFIIDANINGTEIPMLFDSGASTIALSLDAAQDLGVRRHRLKFTHQVSTANGIVSAAPVTLDRVRIGQLDFYDVEATVIDAPLGIALLGMTFLERLDGFEVTGDRLVLRW